MRSTKCGGSSSPYNSLVVGNRPAAVQTGVKRPLPSSGASSISSSDSNLKGDELSSTGVKGEVSKESKNDSRSSKVGYDKQLEPARDYFNENRKTLPSSYDDFVKFVRSTQPKSTAEISELARSYCADFEALVT
ncbi:hypothetical protein QAD02_008157 [Eretmocerus hayati]|uniref:Uncharacterized protein n=1 Tax=Eretmocerus hayati TaxID=131215 RepID=A0ACC2NA10_9HYME|nr:hypothetical protein QAD02_008157 [Eretmocerus hayati]